MSKIFAWLLASAAAHAGVVVFWQPGFPTVESQPVPRETLAGAAPDASFADVAGLRQPETLRDAGLLVLPYGSAVPADAWGAIREYLNRGGNLLVLGGRPFCVPVREENGLFTAERAQYTYAREIGISHTYEAPQRDFARFAWDEDYAFLPETALRARRVWVLVSGGRGVGYFLDSRGDKVAAPVTRQDWTRPGGSRSDTARLGARFVFLSFEPEPGYWESPAGAALIRETAEYARRGATQLRLEVQYGTVAAKETPQVIVHLRQPGRKLRGTMRVDLLSGAESLEAAVLVCSGESMDQEVTFRGGLAPGLYTVRAVYDDGGPREEVRTGFWSRDVKLLESGERIEVSGAYFRKGGAPYVPVGANYFTTDANRSGFFTGGKNGGNAWVWDRDFAEMERLGITFVRTGTWLNQADYIDPASGRADERFLRMLESYLLCAARHAIQVHFTFFAFDPQTLRPAAGDKPAQLGPGLNPYTDPVAIAAQKKWVASIVERFRNVPFLSWDLINEPTFSDPKKHFKGNAPNGDPTELAAWRQWLAERYGSLPSLADAWGIPPEELGGFDKALLPSDLEARREGRQPQVRALDYNLFAQDMFNRWAGEMVAAIRAITGRNRQLITVGQDEGGVTNRVLAQFYGGSGVNFTVNHSWWRDDALLWDSVVAKRPDIPNVIGETGVQPAVRADGARRWDEITALGLEERKLALGLAAGNAGVLHWDWAVGDTFGLKRGDGSRKIWEEMLSGVAGFARKASRYFTGMKPPDVAIVLPQSLQLSAYNVLALEAQQKCVRALYHYARGSAYAVGEYQIALLGNPRLIILPSPWIFSQKAWEELLEKVHGGATLLVSGRIDLDEHFRPVDRAQPLGIPYRPALLDAREHLVTWAGHQSRFTYAGDKCTYAERGDTYSESKWGEGKVIYFPVPLEWSDDLKLIGEVYQYAMARAGAHPDYSTDLQDPGILVSPTRLEAATLYVLTSESAAVTRLSFVDIASGKRFEGVLAPGRAALLLVRPDGEIAASYGWPG